MKQNLLIIFSILLLGQLGAQNLEFDVTPITVTGVTADDFEGVAHTIITNTASTTRNLNWEKVIVEKTETWTIAVCDKNQCYAPTLDAHDFVLNANEGGTMDVHAYTNSTPGCAVVEIIIKDLDNSSLSVSNLYYFNDCATATNEVSRQSLKVYPNPSNGLFTIKGNKQVGSLEVYSLTGKKVDTFTYGNGRWYDISNLPRGTYLVRLTDRDGQELVTKLINKM